MASTILPDDLVSTTWLAEHLGAPTLRVVDIRGYVKAVDEGGGRQSATYTGARDEYDAGHIPTAVYIDWTQDIVDPDGDVKAQIAPPEAFRARMEDLGIGDESDVVVYDHTGGHFATRLWWALKYYGHDRVALLDGGFNRWQAEGREITTDTPAISEATFTPQVRSDMRSDASDVLGLVDSQARQIVDARDPGQYSGAVQRGPRGGHIPTAVNMPISTLLRDDGSWKSGEEIQQTAAEHGVDTSQPVTAYCNGGVTATALLFGMYRAGQEDISNYDGSWNEWGEREDLPVENNRNLWKTNG